MAVSKALIVASLAALGLLVTITVDATMSRSFAVDVKDGAEWRTVAQMGDASGASRGFGMPFPVGSVPVERNGSIDMRLRVENGYPWGYDKHYVVRQGGLILAEGDLRAPASGAGESAFSVPAKRFFDDAGVPAKPINGSQHTAGVNLQIDVGGRETYVYFDIVEAS